jgi:teichuronic acid exporter
MVKHFFWDFLGRFSGFIISLITSIILARLLQPEDFGVIAIAQVFISIISMLMDMGFTTSLIQVKELQKEILNAVFTAILGVALFLAALLFIAAGPIADFYKSGELTLVIRLLSLQLLISALYSVPNAVLYRQMKFKDIMWISLVSAAVASAVGIVLAFLGYGVYSLVVQSIVNAAVLAVLGYTRAGFLPSLDFGFSKISHLTKFSSKIFLSTLLNQVFQKFDVFLFGRIYSPAVVGYYNRAVGLDGFLRTFTSSGILNVLLPRISRMQDDREELKALYYRYLHFISFVFFALAAGLYLLSAETIILLFGSKWYPTIPIFELLVLTSFAFPISSLMLSIIEGTGRGGLFLRIEVVKKIVYLPALVVAFFFDIKYYLIALFVVYYINVGFNAYGVSRVIDFSWQRSMKIVVFYNFLAFLVTALAKLVFYFIPLENNIVRIIIGGILITGLYGLFHALFNTKGWELFRELLVKTVFRSRFLKFKAVK